MRRLLILAALCVGSVTANADELFEVNKSQGPYFTLLYEIISLQNENIIRSVSINRGNCNIIRWFLTSEGKLTIDGTPEATNPFPVHLRFGQHAAFQASCDAIELKIDSDLGSQVFNWGTHSSISGPKQNSGDRREAYLRTCVPACTEAGGEPDSCKGACVCVIDSSIRLNRPIENADIERCGQDVR